MNLLHTFPPNAHSKSSNERETSDFQIRADPIRDRWESSRHLAPGCKQAGNRTLCPDGDDQSVWTDVSARMETR